MSRPTRIVAWAWGLGSLLAAALWAQEPQLDLTGKQALNVARGFSPEKAYQIGDVDHVNLFNGNLTIQIPIGGSYPIGPNLSFQLALTYNSHPWDFELVGTDADVVPARGMNAGLGWRVSLGELLDPTDVNNPTAGAWLYIDPAGAQHVFYRKLHANEAVVTNVFYTRDSTYLRLQKVTESNAVVWKLEFPDGTVHRFKSVTGDGAPLDTPKFRLVEVRDAFGNFYKVSYFAATTNPPLPRRWVIEDSASSQRSFKVYFDETETTAGRYYKTRGGVVSSIELPKVGGTATWSFAYQVLTSEAPCGNVNTENQGENAPFLVKVTQPDGTTWEMSDPLASLGLGYITDGPNACSASAGLIKRLRLPTKGLLEWDWASYRFPSDQSSNCRDFFNLPAGVSARRLGPRDLSAPGAAWNQWLYEQKYPPTGSGWNCRTGGVPSSYSLTTIKTPLGPRTENYFSVNLGASSGDPNEYGFPISHHEESGAGMGASTKVYSSAAGGTLLRSTYVRYEWDGQPSDHANQRLTAQKTIYNDDGNRESTLVSSQFDGVGHYRKTLTGGTFDSGNVRGALITYDGRYADFQHLGIGSNAAIWPEGEPWIWTPYGSTQAWEGSVDPPGAPAPLTEQFCFDRATGFLKRHRVLAGGSPAANDQLQVFTGTSGFVTREQDYGGDVPAQALSTSSDLCNLTPPSSDAYCIDHTYAYGVLQTSAYMRNGDVQQMPFKSVEQTIDANTGLVVSSKSPDERSTVFQYDALGRPTFVKPQDGLSTWTQYSYNPATYNSQTLAGTQASVGVLQRPNGAISGTALASSGIAFDDLGRVYRESFTMPNGTSSVRETLYNANGWKLSESELNTAGQSAGKTTYQSYDAFGRPTSILPPDGISHQITFAYTGDRLVKRKVKIGTQSTSENWAETTETYDRQARLIAVGEPIGPNDSELTTSYGYDFGGRLITVASGSQNRTFSYDGRGLLKSEDHPEKDQPGGNDVTYPQYDARGHALEKIEGDTHLAFGYDRAERLVSVYDPTPEPDRPLKELVYDSAAGAGSYAKGKLVTAVRHNWVRPVDAIPGAAQTDTPITENLIYSAANGALSGRATTIGGVSFQQGWTYNALGEVAGLTYPRCSSGTNCQASTAARAIDLTYTQGRLTAVTQSLPLASTLGTLTYHPNGMVWKVTHGNAVIDTTANDPNQMRRPYSISTSAAAVVLGPYLYDGAGNIRAIGGNTMLYDKASRLLDFKFDAGQQQQYTYDRWGNLTQIKTIVGASITTQGFVMDGTTNRLSGVGYDKAGNQTSWGSYTYLYDAFNQMINLDGGGNDESYYYTASEERLLSTHYSGAGLPAGRTNTYRLRDLDGEVLTEYTLTGSDTSAHWAWRKDYVYRDGLLLASLAPGPGGTATWHYTLDHLGTPRLITTAGGAYVSDHHYYPYGQELNPQIDDALKFTSHERDFNTTPATIDDLDYMHARHCSPVTGRFLATDKLDILSMQFGDQEEQEQFRHHLQVPQSWNRYAYTLGNPLKLVDRDGDSATAAMQVSFELGGGLGLSKVEAVITAVAPPVAAGVAGGVIGYGVGTAINKIPIGGGRNVGSAVSGLMAGILFSSQAGDAKEFIATKANTVYEHIHRYPSPDPGDPNDQHNKKNVGDRMRKHLEAATNRLKRLQGKTRVEYEKIIEKSSQALENWIAGG